MPNQKYNINLAIPDNNIAKLVKYWLILAISSLAAAGLYSLPPVILRGPFFADKLPIEHIFSTSLVVHVDLSVLVWFLSIGGVFWSTLASPHQFKIQKTSFILAALGATIIALSPFAGDTHPLKNNYIPVLQNPVFFLGLSLFACGILFQATLTLLNYNKAKENLLNLGIYISAIITIIAVACFIIAHNLTPVPDDLDFLYYYESIFWGGGHVLQFTYVTLMLLAWLWLNKVCNFKQLLPNKIILILLLLNLIFTIPSPFFYLSDNVSNLFTKQMQHAGGISSFFIGGAIIFAALQKNKKTNIHHSIKACLFFSIILFGYGGALGYMISGVNVTIPAHYHGSIVAVTLSFIGLSYYLLPKLGFAQIKGKLATSQPYIYSVGQIMHITGLAWMGGYGALRKSAGSSQHIDTIAGKALFFSGGSLAIIGGLLFIIIAFKSILSNKS